MRKRLKLLVAFTLSSVAVLVRADDVMDAKQAAIEWLILLDNASFVEGYQTSSASLRQAITETVWLRSMKAVREPLGTAAKRTLISANDAPSLPDAPPAHYVVLKFNTVFGEKKTPTLETVTPVLEADGKWRVSGYFLN